MPGVIIIEALAQATGLLAFATAGRTPGEGELYYFVGIDKARFKKPVEPGDQLVLKADLDAHPAQHLEIRYAGRGGWQGRGQGRDHVCTGSDQLMIDARAVVDPGARLGNKVSVGPFSIIEADVEIGDGTWIGPHVVVRSGTRMGSRKSYFSVRFDWRRSAGQEVCGRADPPRDRRTATPSASAVRSIVARLRMRA